MIQDSGTTLLKPFPSSSPFPFPSPFPLSLALALALRSDKVLDRNEACAKIPAVDAGNSAGPPATNDGADLRRTQ
jgi:hypothetical protein